MHVQQVYTAGALMQIVNILGNQQKFAVELMLESSQCGVSQVWPYLL